MPNEFESPESRAHVAHARALAAAITEAGRQAVEEHWLHGRPVVVWQDGRVVWLGPGGVEVPEPPLPKK
jgi:hypothetical protein